MNKTFLKRFVVGELLPKRFICSLLIIYSLMIPYAFWCSDQIIFQLRKASYSDDPSFLKLTTADGAKISALYLPNSHATYTILYSHGNAEDLGDVKSGLENLAEIGFSVFAYDYHGYGTSQGKPSEQNAYLDINATYDYLTQHLLIPPNRIIVYGRSVGGGPSVDLATRKSVAGLILESPFTTAFRVATRIPILPFDKFRNIEKIPNVHCPVLVMHGKKDRIIPFSHGEDLFKCANEPKCCLWVDKAGHNDLPWVTGELYGKTLKSFSELIDQIQSHID